MDPKNIQLLVSDDFDAVNQIILGQLHSDVDLVETISRYLIDSGGKRIRPMLVLLVARYCGYKGELHTLLATIIEFLHTATLLHDDVVDISQLRRGRPTSNAVWGNAPSVLVGDFLYSRAFQMMVRIGDMKILSILAETTNQIAEGEVRQLTHVHNADLTKSEYYEIIKAKTAVLFCAASHTAAILSSAPNDQVIALKEYGTHLGMTFQLVDDLLDYNGDAEEMGKNVGDDLMEGKVTLPLIYTMQHANQDDLTMIREAINKGETEHAERIVQLVKNSGALAYTQQQAVNEVQKASSLLEGLPRNRYRDALNDLLEAAVHRSK